MYTYIVYIIIMYVYLIVYDCRRDVLTLSSTCISGSVRSSPIWRTKSKETLKIRFKEQVLRYV